MAVFAYCCYAMYSKKFPSIYSNVIKIVNGSFPRRGVTAIQRKTLKDKQKINAKNL